MQVSAIMAGGVLHKKGSFSKPARLAATAISGVI